MWSDTLLLLERSHIARMILWGASSVVLATLVLAWASVRRRQSSLLIQFAAQTAFWGAGTLALGFVWRNSLGLRDLQQSLVLSNIMWFQAGLGTGITGIGLALLLCGLLFGRRQGLMGSGSGIAVQGAAMALLPLMFLGSMSAAQAS